MMVLNQSQHHRLQAWILIWPLCWFFPKILHGQKSLPPLHGNTRHKPLEEGVLVSYFCCNKLQTWRLNTTLMYCLTALEVRKPKRVPLQAKIQCQQSSSPSGGSRGESTSLPFPASKRLPAFLVSWPLLAITSLWPLPPSSHFLLWFWPSCIPLIKNCDYTGPTWIIQDNLPISRSLT